MKKLISELHSLAWTLGGTGMVLITLSGRTLKFGVYITVASLFVHLAGALLKGDDSVE